MDLSSLNQFLKDLPDIRTGPEQYGVQSKEDVCSELIRQVKRKAATPTSKLVVVVLESVRETLKIEGIAPSSTAVFAALSSCLEQSDEASLTAACCTALSMTLPRVPMAVLRSKSTECVRNLMIQIESAGEAALPCLGTLIAAASPASWPAVVPAYSYLLSLVVDEDAKVRKKSQNALLEIFKAFSGEEALVGVHQAASDALVESSAQILAGPERTAQEAARASNKQRSKAEENIRIAVSRALRIMAALKSVICLLPEPSAQRVCSQILSLFPLQQILLTTSATEILLALSSTASPSTLEQVLKALLSINALWDTNDATLEMSLVHLLESLAIGVENGAHLAHVFHVLVPQLASRIEGVARAAAEVMVRLAKEAITEDLVSSSPIQDNQAAPIMSIISAVESSFGAQYFDSWELCLNVAQELIASLGRAGSPLASGLIEKIGELCAGVDDVIAASDSIESARIAEVAQNTLGVCIRALGPEAVLEHLPLEIEEALDGEAEGRTWLIPLLKMYMKGGRLAFWLTDIYPLILKIGARCDAAEPQSRQRATLYALELQLWSTLPSFSSWAEDIPECFEEFTKSTGPVFAEREDVRLYVSQALQKICAQTRKILMHTCEEAGHPDPCMAADMDIEDTDDMGDELFDDHAYLGRFSAEDGRSRAAMLKSGSKIWLPMLLNAFVGTQTSKRNHIQSAISGYSCICEGAVVSAVFKSALARLMKVANQLKTGELGRDAVMEGGDSDLERYCTYIEAVYALLGGLDVNALNIVYQLVSKDIDERDPAVQKKAYKILQYLVEHRADFYGQDFEGLVERILQAGSTAMSASRGFRIRCLKSIILHLLSGQQNVDLDKIPSIDAGDDAVVNTVDSVRLVMVPLVAEIVLSIKESNKRTRAAAFDLVIEVTSAMDENDEENGVASMAHLVLGGLVGSTSQLVSASVMALARIMFEFTPNMVPMIHDLLPAVLMLLHSKSREVIKAVLGFLKIVIMRLDSETLLLYTPKILEGTLIWAEDSKNKFRLKVRVILERLAKKVGFEALERHIPESHRSLLTHIRKEMKRKDRSKGARSEMDWDDQSFAHTVNTVSTRGGKSSAVSKDPSTWQSDVFSQDSAKSSKSLGRKSARVHGRHIGAGIAETGPMDPLNLLEGSTIRRMVGMNVRRTGYIEKERMAEDAITFDRGDDGKLIINEESKKKRGREAEVDYVDSDDDSDDEILRGITGQELALKGSQSMAKAASYAGTLSRYGDRASKKKAGRGSSISGERFKSTKAGGDVKGKSKVEPFAYWPLDRRLMNRRQHKTKAAKDALKAVVNAGGKRRKR